MSDLPNFSGGQYREVLTVLKWKFLNFKFTIRRNTLLRTS